tara:strand:+ start:5478 stop:5690 length:213 start_codon:yes stop_codon:yes gene_type:complete
MKTNEIPPKTLIELCDKVLPELECVLNDLNYVGDDDGFKKVRELIEEVDFVREISIKRYQEFQNRRNDAY